MKQTGVVASSGCAKAAWGCDRRETPTAKGLERQQREGLCYPEETPRFSTSLSEWFWFCNGELGTIHKNKSRASPGCLGHGARKFTVLLPQRNVSTAWRAGNGQQFLRFCAPRLLCHGTPDFQPGIKSPEMKTPFPSLLLALAMGTGSAMGA